MIREGVVSTPIPGVQDSVSMRWRTFGESVCVCSFYAPHPGIDVNVRVAELTATVRHVRSTVDLPMVIAGDANVWFPYFSLGRSRSVDNLVVPSPDQATHVAGAALVLALISSHCPCSMLVHSGLQCCVEAPGWCPIMGSDHYLCVASASLIHRPAHVQSQRLLPLRNWSSTLLRGYGDLCTWSGRVFSCLQGPTPDCPARCLDVVDKLYDQSLSVLSWHSPRPRMVPRRRQPSWWTHECYSACVARMVRGGTIVGIQIPCCTLDSEGLVWHSIAQCARPVARIGRIGNLVSHHSLSLSLDWQLPSSATLSVVQLIRVATNQIGGLLMGTLAFRSRSCWTIGDIVPVFKRGDPTLPNNYRPIFLASCFFKVLEHLVHSRIASHITPQLDVSQGGFRWGADVLVGSLVSILSARSSSHTFVAFIDNQKAFDTSWVEGTLVRLFDAGVRGRMWSFMCNFLHGTQSQVRCGSSLSEPWLDSGIAQGSPLSTAFQPPHQQPHCVCATSCPCVQFCSSSLRVPGQLYADDLELSAECEFDLQVALEAVARWGRQWQFSFGIGPTKSAVMVFGPRRSIPPCSVHLGGDPLPIVMEYPNLGVILTPTLSWTAHARHLVTRGNRLFAQCVAWCKTEGLSLRFASSLFTSYVLPSISWGSEFSCPSGDRLCSAPLGQIPSWMPPGFPVGAVLLACFHSSDVYTPCPPMAAVLSLHSCSRNH